ncbi:MAG TPA: alpha/beta hydrolase domain-containing protein [Usitatibacter sp.]|jgi:hypothetical protein
MRIGSAIALAIASLSLPAAAALTRLDLATTKPFGTFLPGEYAISEGKVYGELAPDEAIPGLDKVERNERGRVPYSARIILIHPVDPKKGNGTLLADVPNRGNAYAEALYNSPRDAPFQSGTLEQGTGFLQDHGFTVAEVYWELGQGADLPSFMDGATKRYVEGVGFAIMRDTADFLAHGTVDSTGKPNPLAGAVKRVIASGKSQSGRFLKSFLLNGFNGVNGHRVFDGMHIFVSGSGQLPILSTGTGPESSANGIPTFDDPEMRGVNEEPLALAELLGKVTARGEALPKMFFQNSTTDYYAIRTSLSRTGGSGTVEQTVPAGVRIYDMASTSHVVVPRQNACSLQPNPLDWAPVSRALLLRLDEWVAVNREPPGSKLMPLQPASSMGAALGAPEHLPNAVVQIPRRDADGNALGGVRLPEAEVPLGTYAGLNLPHSRGCMLIGAFVPFAYSKAGRGVEEDPRPSISERYATRDIYVDRVRNAARRLVGEGFMLPEDAAIVVQGVASNPNLAAPKR